MMDIYKNNQELDILYDFTQYLTLPKSYEYQNEYKKIDNTLLLIKNGSHLFSYLNPFNCLFDFIIQKVEDSEFVSINSKQFLFNNLVKLFNENKIDYLNFTIDHIIKLDNKFLKTTVIFTDENEKEFILNKENRVIKDLKGDNIKVKSNQKALVYFYKRINNNSKPGVIIFDKNQIRKNMIFNITNLKKNPISIYIAKDFGFEECYPMLNKKSWIYVENKAYSNNYISTIYVENIFDNSDYELYEEEGEKYIIYIFDSFQNNIASLNSDNYNISNAIYVNNLMTPGNKYNFEIIQPNSNGSLILNSINKAKFKYQFIMCKNEINENMRLKIENSNNYLGHYGYPIERNLLYHEYLEWEIDNNEILSHTFDIDSKLLFVYSFYSDTYSENIYHHNDFEIISITQMEKNNLQILFRSAYHSSQERYYIIVGIKDEFNNMDSFSDECYLAELLISNSSSIIVKSFYEEYLKSQSYDYSPIYFYEEINITNLNVNIDTKLIINVICYSAFTEKLLLFYSPKEFKIENEKEPVEIIFNKEVQFDLVDKNYFKFEYILEKDIIETFSIIFNNYNSFEFILIGPQKHFYQEVISNNVEFEFSLTESGIYYIKLVPLYTYKNYYETFTLFIPGKIIETIDLTKKLYYNNIKKVFNYQANPSMIKVNNLKDNKFIYFDYSVKENNYYNKKSYCQNPFEICNKNNECQKNITTYEFKKGDEYIIYINIIQCSNSNYFYYIFII